jgi:hypothetical protein
MDSIRVTLLDLGFGRGRTGSALKNLAGVSHAEGVRVHFRTSGKSKRKYGLKRHGELDYCSSELTKIRLQREQ